MRLVRDGLVNYAGYASASLAGMVLVPILLRGLTPELYGLWIAATALEYSASCLTGGLGRAVAREVAGAGVDGRKHETQRFVAAAASGYILFALLGALLIGLLGFPLSSGLRLSRESREVAPYVFGLAGIAFFGDQLLAFAAEVLTGKRRFATLNLVTGSGVLVRTVGIVVLLSKGSSLLPVAAWHSLVSLSLAAAAMLLVARMEPGYLPRPWNVQWTAFRSQTRFCVSTQATAGFTSLLWRSAPFLIGMRLGSAAIVPFEIGQKLSLVLFAMSWQVAEVVYPAASQYHYAQERIRAQRLLLVGTRGIVLVTLPICILLWILAPHLLQVWLGTAHADSVPVLRLTTLAVFTDTAAAIAVQILYGRGAVGTVLKLTAAAALANIGLTLALLGGLGVTAGGWGLCLTVPAVAFVYIKTAARSCEITVTELLQFAAGGLVVPSVTCAATAGGFAHWAPPSNWMTLVIAATSALAAYGVVAGFTFAASQSRGQLSRGAYSVCRRLRKALERVPGLRGPIRFASELKVFEMDTPCPVLQAGCDAVEPRAFHHALLRYGVPLAFRAVRRQTPLGVRQKGRTGNLPSSGLLPEQSTAGSDRMTFGRAAIVVLVALALDVGLEVGLRVFTDYNNKWNVRLGAAKVFDPVTGFRNKPHYDFGDGAVTNERGYLAPEGITPDKPPGKLRFVYLGDSVTFLPLSANYPRQFAELVRQRRGREVETVNTAVPGFSSENARALFDSEVSKLHGDALFIYLGWNDLGLFGPEGLPYKRQEAGYTLSPLQRVLSQSYTIRLIYVLRRFLDRFTPAVEAPLTPAEERLYGAYWPQHLESNLRAIIQAARPNYDRIVLVNLATITNPNPTPDELRKVHFPVGMGKNMRKLDRLVQSYNAVVAKVAAEEGVPLVDLHAAFDSREARAELTDSCHVTPAGAARIARALLDGAQLPD